MKILRFNKTITDGKIGVTMNVDEATPAFPTQQTTIPVGSDRNAGWIWHVQLSNEYVFCKHIGRPTVGIPVRDFVELCVAFQPELSWTPIFTKQPTAADVTFDINSDIPFTTQWQVSQDGQNWVNADNPEVPGIYRCIATNAAGGEFSNQFAILPPPPPPEPPQPTLSEPEPQ